MITFPSNPAVDQLHTAENNVVYKFDGVAWNTVAAIGSGVWGTITGTLADQADLVSALAGKTPNGHTHTASSVSDFDAAVNGALAAGASAPTLVDNLDMSFSLDNDTTLRIQVRGADGVTRSATLTLT